MNCVMHGHHFYVLFLRLRRNIITPNPAPHMQTITLPNAIWKKPIIGTTRNDEIYIFKIWSMRVNFERDNIDQSGS